MLTHLKESCHATNCVHGTARTNDAPKVSARPLRDIEECILEAAPKHGEPPISRRKLAPRAGYAYTRHFLEAVKQLLADGLLVEHDGRVAVAP